jgi:hypothetical protein
MTIHMVTAVLHLKTTMVVQTLDMEVVSTGVATEAVGESIIPEHLHQWCSFLLLTHLHALLNN